MTGMSNDTRAEYILQLIREELTRNDIDAVVDHADELIMRTAQILHNPSLEAVLSWTT
jgi:hypothetical protein